MVWPLDLGRHPIDWERRSCILTSELASTRPRKARRFLSVRAARKLIQGNRMKEEENVRIDMTRPRLDLLLVDNKLALSRSGICFLTVLPSC